VNPGRACIGAVLLAGLQACSSLGPDALSQGRPAYNEAIAATNAEQYLSWIVRQRYGLPSSQLAVASITANVRFSSTANVDVGVGPSENFVGNLVPLSGGVTYDENPTISYVPLQGEKHLRKLLSPVPMGTLGLLLNINHQPSGILAVLVKRVNGIPNADFLRDSSQEVDQRFVELMAVTTRLSRADKLTFYESGDEVKSYYLWIHDYLHQNAEDVRTFLSLLEIDGIETDGGDITLPVVSALRRSTNQSIALQMRSVADIGRVAAASVDVPESDSASGLTLSYSKPGLAGNYIRINRAAERPPTAATATRFRDWWYYIAGDDLPSKEYFLLFEMLMSGQLSDAASDFRAPVLTVPVN